MTPTRLTHLRALFQISAIPYAGRTDDESWLVFFPQGYRRHGDGTEAATGPTEEEAVRTLLYRWGVRLNDNGTVDAVPGARMLALRPDASVPDTIGVWVPCTVIDVDSIARWNVRFTDGTEAVRDRDTLRVPTDL